MRRLPSSTLVAALLAAAFAAGCAAPSVDPGAAAAAALASQAAAYDAIERAIGEPLEEDHDHADNALHQGHYNLDRVVTVAGEANRTPLPTEGYVESAVKGGFAYLCRTGPEQGLVVFDVSDVEHPRQVGYLNLDAGFEADIEVSDDGQWGFWETQRFPTSGQAPNPTSPGANAPHGIHVVDLSDKSNPRWAGFTPVLPDGPHSITYANVSGRHILFASAYAFAYAYGGVNVPAAQRLLIYELDTSVPGIATLKELYSYTDPTAGQLSPVNRDGAFPHDVSVAVHPFTGRTYAYVSYWDLGVVILDVTDPAHPIKVGQAVDFGAAPTREIHMARQAEAPIAGKVILVTEPEIGSQPTTGYLSVIDVSDPTSPRFLSNWKIPGNSTSAGGSLGPHYFDLRGGRIALASYHAGFWVVDIHDAANLARPRTVAYAMPQGNGGTGLPGPAAGLGGLTAFDAWWADPTHVVASESGNGLTVFRYTGPTPAEDQPYVG